MKLWTLTTLSTALLLILSGCGATPTPKKEAVVDSTLPVIELTKTGTFADMKAIAFEWKTLQDSRVEGIYIYKMSPSEDGKKSEQAYYTTIENRFATHYVDNGVKPDSRYSYSFKTFSKDAESMPSKIVTVNSLPVLESVSWIHSVTGMPRSAKLIWRPHTNQKVKAYLIERKTLSDEKYEEVGRVHGRLNAEFIDKDLKDNYVYKYRVRVWTYDDIVSTPSEIVKVITKALPKKVTNIRTTTDLPKKVELYWSKSTEEDFALYHVYRAEESDGTYELIAKLHNNNHTDKIDIDGKKYFYRVSVVDIDGLESLHEESIVGKTLVRPATPSLVEAKLIDNSIEIVWSNSDKRTKSYVIRKKEKKGWFDATTEDITDLTSQRFVDSKIVAGATYFYKVYAVDANKILSEESIEVQVKVPDSDKIIPIKEEAPQEAISVSTESSIVEQGEVAVPTQNLDLDQL